MFSLYDRCVCGHRHPVHTAWGTCRGCSACSEDPGDHPFVQCPCRRFEHDAVDTSQEDPTLDSR
jgi:hypothetical protein